MGSIVQHLAHHVVARASCSTEALRGVLLHGLNRLRSACARPVPLSVCIWRGGALGGGETGGKMKSTVSLSHAKGVTYFHRCLAQLKLQVPEGQFQAEAIGKETPLALLLQARAYLRPPLLHHLL